MTATPPAQPATAPKNGSQGWLKKLWLLLWPKPLAVGTIVLYLLGASIYAYWGRVEGIVPVSEVQLRGLIARPGVDRPTEPLSFSTRFVAQVRVIWMVPPPSKNEAPPLWSRQNTPLAGLVVEADNCASIGFVMAAPPPPPAPINSSQAARPLEPPEASGLPRLLLSVMSAGISGCPAQVRWSANPTGDDSAPINVGRGDTIAIAFAPLTGPPLLPIFPKRSAFGFEGARPCGSLNWNGAAVDGHPCMFTSRTSLEDVQLLVLGPKDSGCAGQRDDGVPWALCLKFRSAPFAPNSGSWADFARLDVKTFAPFLRWAL
jgi:hypothetical protein